MTLAVLGMALLLCLGILLGTAWTMQAVQPNLQRQAKERHRLNEEWLAIRAARRKRDVCPRCGNYAHPDWYSAPAVVTDRTKDDWAA